MRPYLLPLLAIALAGPALAQSTLTLDDFDLNAKKPAKAGEPNRGAASEMESCLVDQANCKNAEYKSSASFSVDDVVNLGIVDREEVKPAALSSAGMAGDTAKADTAQTLPSIDMEILFDYDSANLRSDQYPKLMQLAEILKGARFAEFRFLLLGHSDAKGNADYNQILSQKRAKAVSDFIESFAGLPANRLVASGLGASRLKDTADPFGAQNRRVQLVLVPVK